ncbi:MAG: FAD binding domain-containing protein [Ferruginibacter sp.]
MLQFILNDKEISTALPAATTVLDFIRYNRHLTGTKIGCREGDCGACTVLVGEIKNNRLVYHAATSCLMALGNAAGKHIVTIEGINGADLNLVQEAFAAEGATQCGFCTPGFIVSLTGFCFNDQEKNISNAVDSMNGNICRCTGYKSIERAAQRVVNGLRDCKDDALNFAIAQKIIPEYFAGIKERLLKLMPYPSEQEFVTKNLGGGTDLYVQQHDTMAEEHIRFLNNDSQLKFIRLREEICEIGGAATVSDIDGSEIFQKYFKALPAYIKLVSSTQIRNMATLAGNFVNASPIGDFTIFFLALDAQLVLRDTTTGVIKGDSFYKAVTFNDDKNTRQIPLRNFYKGYKQLDKEPGEIVERITFKIPASTDRFNFEKVSKRTHLDIASVNTAIYIQMNGDEIAAASLSAGGVGPIPMYLKKASDFLTGKKMSTAVLGELIKIAGSEITPISDARGTAAYKRLLLTQLIKAHVVKLFPSIPVNEILTA